MAVAHNVRLRRLRKAAKQYAEAALQAALNDVSDDGGQPSSINDQQQASKVKPSQSLELPREVSEGQNFREFKTLKTLVRERRDGQELSAYLLDVWPLITATTTNEGAKRLWLLHVTSNPVAPEGTVQALQMSILW